MIDLHCHPLPGVDDGPASTEDAVAMLRRAHCGHPDAATPHISPRYPDNRAGNIGSAVVALQTEAAAASVESGSSPELSWISCTARLCTIGVALAASWERSVHAR